VLVGTIVRSPAGFGGIVREAEDDLLDSGFAAARAAFDSRSELATRGIRFLQVAPPRGIVRAVHGVEVLAANQTQLAWTFLIVVSGGFSYRRDAEGIGGA
jgi:hypothetical protein